MNKFWISAAVWTLVFILSHLLGGDSSTVTSKYIPDTKTSWSIPEMNVVLYFFGLFVAYIVTGINVIEQWNRRPVLFLGKYVATKGPGFCWIEPALHKTLEDVLVIDDTLQLNVANVQTHDNVPIAFNLVLTDRVINAEKYIVEVADADDSIQQRALATVTECVGNTELDNILHDRTKLNQEIQRSLQTRVGNWGVQIIAVELKDIKITDPQIEQAIAQKAKAGKEAEAELVRAEMQLQITKKLKAAAAEMDESTWRLKGIEAMLELCRSASNNTVIIPNDIVQSLATLMPKSKTV